MLGQRQGKRESQEVRESFREKRVERDLRDKTSQGGFLTFKVN
jgi:hypothetical protein